MTHKKWPWSPQCSNWRMQLAVQVGCTWGQSSFTFAGFNGLSMVMIATLLCGGWGGVPSTFRFAPSSTSVMIESNIRYCVPCCQMKVRPRVTCRPIDNGHGAALKEMDMKITLRSLVYTRNASVESCGPPPVANLTGLCSAFITWLNHDATATPCRLAMPSDIQCHAAPVLRTRNTS